MNLCASKKYVNNFSKCIDNISREYAPIIK